MIDLLSRARLCVHQEVEKPARTATDIDVPKGGCVKANQYEGSRQHIGLNIAKSVFQFMA